MLDFFNMNKVLITLILSLFASGAIAQELTCLDKLLPNNRYSGLHQITKEEWQDTGTDFNNVAAKVALNSLLRSKLFCKETEYKIVIEPFCSFLAPDIAKSQVCFAYTSIGHFTFTRDSGKNVNFIFTRDKTYAEP